MAPPLVRPLSAPNPPTPRLGVSNASNTSADSQVGSGVSNVCHLHLYDAPTAELMQRLFPDKQSSPIDYHRELRIRGVIVHDENDEAHPSDWNTLQSYLSSNEGREELDLLCVRGARRMLHLMDDNELEGVLLFLLSNFGAMCEKDDVVKLCRRKEWKTIPLPWRGAEAAELPTLCPDLTFGHGGGSDLIPAGLHRVISPFFTPIPEEPSLLLPCVTVYVKGGDDEHIRHMSQHAAAIMLRNMVELSLVIMPSRLLKEMLSLENRVSVLTVSVLSSSMVLACHWLKRDIVLGNVEYHSRDMQSWNLNDQDQMADSFNYIFRAIRWVLNKNRSWVIGRLDQLIWDGGFD
ncbi:uncharacterized protein KD926_002250 [Aspergillus affinis]|uniref:uncharacterized protein n=1 Tax=Aspergillus affinis TaxID=1070780 RepID=UPI0022FEAF03|nr:uncharacterized protein KD926_002250 [Aspergillus affinis]KAI9036162.1 hypothetical protein KD926_002250 [Aspergillus affinis]